MEVSSWENHLFLWAIYTMAMLNNQRVINSCLSVFIGVATSVLVSIKPTITTEPMKNTPIPSKWKYQLVENNFPYYGSVHNPHSTPIKSTCIIQLLPNYRYFPLHPTTIIPVEIGGIDHRA